MNSLVLERFAQSVDGYFLTLMVYIGDKLGFFKDLAAHGPSTAQEIASRTNTNERYVREWLFGLVSSGYVDRSEEDESRFLLTPDQEEAFAKEGTTNFLGGTIQMVVGSSQVVEPLLAAFKNGGGVKMDVYGSDVWMGMERHTSLKFKNHLVSEWLPLLSEEKVLKKMRDGVRVVDIGCGRGKALIELASAYPNCQYVGYDIFEPSLQRARENAKEAGLQIQFEAIAKDATSLPSKEKFDIIFVFDVIHDAADPLRLLKMIRSSLKEDGVFVCMDIKCEKDPKKNSSFAYGMSLFFCMTTSLAEGGLGLGTCGLTEEVVQRLFIKEAGFSSVRQVNINHPGNVLWEALP